MEEWKDFDVSAYIRAGSLEAGDYYFYAESDPDPKIRWLFENAAENSNYEIIDYDVLDIDFFDTDNNSVNPSADIYITKTKSVPFGCAFVYTGDAFSRLDVTNCENGIKVDTKTPEKIIVATLAVEERSEEYSGDIDDLEIVSQESSGNMEIEYEISGRPISNDTKKNADKALPDNDPETGYSDAAEVSIPDRLVPDGKPADTGDTGTGAAVIAVTGAAALFITFAVMKMKKTDE